MLTISWVICWVAAHILGSCPVMLNSHLQMDAQLHCLGVTEPKLVLADDVLSEELGKVTNELRKRNVGPVYCWSSIAHLSKEAKAGVKELPWGETTQEQRRGIESEEGMEALQQESDGNIFFTSGTTGYPKAVLSTQRGSLHNVVSGGVAATRSFLRMGLTLPQILQMQANPPAQTVQLMSIPLFHVTGNIPGLLKLLATGSKVVFQRKWNVSEAVRLCVEEKVTGIGGVPAIATAIIQSPELPKDHQFTSVGYGGAPPPSRLAGDINKRWPSAIVGQGWGMTETNGVVCQVFGKDYVDNPTSVGPVIPICDIKVVDPETKEILPDGQMGVIYSKGENNMVCYLKNPEATAELFDEDGYIDTGDMGIIDANGFLHLTDRKKDLIIRGGENIASAEVENALALDDRLAEVAAVAVPCERMGERVGAMVSLAPGAEASEADIIAAVEKRLRHAARPVIVHVSDEPLPRNANGKIIKADCKKLVAKMWVDRTAGEVRAKL